MPPISSPARRVLGEKDANASLNITSPRKSLKTSNSSRPHASPQRKTRVLSDAIIAVSASPKIGQKRRITEVEGVETQDWDERIKASQGTDIISDSASEADQAETSMLSTRSAADTTMTSFGIGPGEDSQMDIHFHLPEPEMSQRSLEKIHAVTLPQNHSQPSQFREHPILEQQASLDSVAMSNFVNFHSDPSSQASDGINMPEPVVLKGQPESNVRETGRSEEKELSEEDKRRAMMQEKAAQLRTKLQLALFKVETRQTNTPLSRLKVPESRRRKSPSPPVLIPPPTLHSRKQSTPASTVPHERSGLSPEARVAALRAQATMQKKPSVPSLKMLPFPKIKPTAFSARWTQQAPSSYSHSHPIPQQSHPHTDSSDDQTIELPSSPPISNRSLHIHEDETATAARMRTPSTEEDDSNNALLSMMTSNPHSAANRLSSPIPSRDGNEDSRHNLPLNDVIADLEERRSGSSNPKSEAASGLLELMRSGASDGRDGSGL